MFKIVERFVSLDGEGPTAGELAVFIRFFGCNMNCVWCDTKYSFNEEEECQLLSLDDILEYVLESKVLNVTLTGGEPLLTKNIMDVLKALNAYKHLKVHVETNGSVDISSFRKEADSISFVVDYKLPYSGMESLMCLNNLSEVREGDVYKFVIADNNDLLRAYDIIEKYRLREKCYVHLSPIPSLIAPSIVAGFIKEKSLTNVKLQLQLHKIIWPNQLKGI